MLNKPRTMLAGVVAGLLSGGAAEANPTGAAVVHGRASFAHPAARMLNIANSPGAIINWQGFSIDRGEITRFVQQSNTSAVLNRVTGGNPSAILGQLVSNGKVFLINPNGIAFGANARVDTAGLVAATLDIKDADFIAGRYAFKGGPAAGAIRNEGYVKTARGGEIVFIAPSIENAGTLQVDHGQLILAAGQQVRLTSLDVDDVTFAVQAPTDKVLNLGQLLAEQGAIGVFAGTLKNSGTISADSLSRDAGGRIVLSAQGAVTQTAGGALSARGGSGGDIRIESKTDTTLVNGRVDASGASGSGGRIVVTGERVGVLQDAALDASGAQAGGEVRVGGGWHGAERDVGNADQTTVVKGALITADARTRGTGGDVVVWSDRETRFAGAISARGGKTRGDGGRVEVSGKERLAMRGFIDVGAAFGTPGLILLDPRDITITNTTATNDNQVGGADSAILFGDDIGGSGVNATSDDFTLSDEALEALSGNIALQANRNFTVNAGLSGGLSFTNPGQSFSVRAGGNIAINSAITTNNGLISLSAGDVGAIGGPLANATLTVSAALASGGGNILLSNAGSGANTVNASINAGTGNLTFNTPNVVTLGNGTLTANLFSNSNVNGGLTSTSSTLILNGLTLASDFTVANGTTVTVTNGLTLSNNAKVNVNSANSTTDLRFTGTQSVSGTGELVFSGTTPFARIYATTPNSDVLTLGSGVTVRGNIGGSLGLSSRGLDIKGTVIGNSSNGALVIDGLNWVNEGTLRVVSGTLSTAGTWSGTTSAAYDVQGGTLQLDGTFKTTDLNIGTKFTRSGGAVTITGVLDNTADLLALDGSTGAFNLSSGGVVRGGTVNGSGVNALGVLAGQQGGLDGVTLASDFTVANGATVTVTNGLTLSNNAKVNVNSASSTTDLRFTGTQSVLGTGELVFSGTTPFARIYATTPNSDVLTLGSGVTVRGNIGGSLGLSSRGLDIKGTVIGNSSNGALVIDGLNWVNEGTLRVVSGTLSTAGTWSGTTSAAYDVQGGTLQLDGTFKTTDLNIGTKFTRSGGAVTITGVLDNTADLLALDGSTGAFNLSSGGVLRGGTVNGSGVNALGVLTGQQGGLDGVTLASDFTVANGATVTVTNGLTLSNNAKVNVNSASSTTDLRFTGTQSVLGTGELVFSGTTPFARIYATTPNSDVLTLGSGVTVRGNIGGSLGLSSRGLDIKGTVIGNSSNGALVIDGLNWVNEGTLRVVSGTLSTAGTWSGTASAAYDVQGGTLQLDGTFKTTDLNIGTKFTRSSGAVTITGVLDNTADLLALDGSTGAFNLSSGGVVRGGTVNGSGVNALGVLAGQQGGLDGVTLASDFTVANGATVTVTNGLTLSNNAKVNVNSANSTTDLRFTGTQSVLGTGELVFSGTTPFARIYATTPNSDVLTLGSGVTVRGNIGGSLGLSSRGLDIKGTVIGNSSNGALVIDGLNWVNEGTLRVVSGTLSTAGTWSGTTSAAYDVQGGTLNLGGSFTTASLNLANQFSDSGGVVAISGTLDNTGHTLALTPTNGPFSLINSGVIKGGIISDSGGVVPIQTSGNSSTLDGVTLDTDFTIASGTTLFVQNGLILKNGRKLIIDSQNQNTDLRFNGNQTLSAEAGGTAEVLFTGISSFGRMFASNGGETLTIGSNILVHGTQGGEIGLGSRGIVNQGTILADTAGKTFSIDAGTFANQGTVLATAGGLVNITGLTTNAGGTLQVDSGSTLSVAGTNWTNVGGQIKAQGGTLNLDGTFTTAALNLANGYTRSGGTVNLKGVMDNSGNTLALTPTTGGMVLVTGTIKGGTLSDSGGVVPTLGATTQGTLDGVILDTDFTVTSGSTLFISDTLGTGKGVILKNGRKLIIDSQNQNSDLRFVGNQTLSAEAGGTAEVLFTGISSFGRMFASNGGETLTIGSNILVHGTQGGEIGLGSRGIVNQGTILADTAGKTFSIDAATFSNQGTVKATAGGVVSITGLTTNAGGTLQVDSSSTLSLAGTNWTNVGGQIKAVGGTLNLGGSFTTAALNLANGFTRSGGIVNLTGVMDNTATILALTPTTGAMQIVGGTLRGGTLSSSGGVVPSLGASAQGTLDNVLLDTDFTVTSGSTLFITDTLGTGKGVILKNGRKLIIDSQNQNADLRFVGNQTLSAEAGGTAEVLFNGISSFGRMFASNGGETLTIGSNILVHGTQGGEIGLGSRGIVNQGTILADTTGKTFSIDAGTFSNQGTVTATGGGVVNITGLTTNAGGTLQVDSGSTLSVAGTNWTNVGGQIKTLGGTLNLDGTFTTAALNLANGYTRSGGTVNLKGVMDNSGNTLALTPTTGGMVLVTGTIKGGTISDSGGVVPTLGASTQGTLDDVLLDTDFTVTSGSTLFISDTLGTGKGVILKNGRKLIIDSQNQNSDLRFVGNQTLSAEAGGTAEVLFTGISSFGRMFASNGGETLTIGSNILVHGTQGGEIGLGSRGIVNQGTILADTAGKTFSIDAGTFTNTGILQSLNGGRFALSNMTSNAGTMNLGSNFTLSTNNVDFTNNGIFSGSGTATVDTSGPIDHAFINNGTLRPGSSPGLLNIAGNLVLSGSSITDIEIQGFARGVNYDAINVTGTAQLGGTLNVQHLVPYSPVDGDSFLVLTSQGARSGSFSNFNTPTVYNQQLGANSYLIQVGASALAVNFWNKDSSDLWTLAGNWSLGHTPTASEIAIIDRGAADPIVTLNAGAQLVAGLQTTERFDLLAGSLSLSGSSRVDTSGTFNLSGTGLLQGNGNLLIDGLFNYTGGSYALTGTTTLRGTGTWSAGKWSSPLTIATGGVLNLNGGAKSWGASAALTNNGTVTWSAGNIDVLGAGSITNNGLFDITAGVTLGDVSALADGLTGAVTFNNTASGTLRTTSVVAPVLGSNGINTSNLGLSANLVNLTNDGVIDIQGGGLRVNVGTGGSASVGGGTVTSTSGSQVKVAAGSTLEFGGTATLANGSTLNMDGAVLTNRGANLTVNGAMKSLAGTNATSTGTLTASGGTATYGASNAFSVASVTVNGGTANFTTTPLTTGALTFSAGVLGGSGPGALVLDVNKVGTWSGGTLAGPLTVSSGGVLTINGGAKSWGASAALTNNGTVTWSAGNIDVLGAGSITNNGLFDITAGVTLGDVSALADGLTGAVTFNNMASGTLRTTSVVAPVLGSNCINTSNLGLSANLVNLTNDGVIDIQGGGLRVNVGTGGSASVGGGTVTSTSGSQVKVAAGSTLEFGGTATLANGSTLNMDGAVLTNRGANLTVNGAMKSLAGTNATSTGTLTASGGTATYGASNAFSVASVTVNGGTANFTTTPLTTGALTFSAGVLGGSGPGALVLDVNKVGTWSGGTLAGPLTVSSGGVLTINGGAKSWGAGAALTNNGTVTWSAGNIDVLGAGSITNNGLFDITAGVTLGDVSALADGLTGAVTFNNMASGTLRTTSVVAPVLGSNGINTSNLGLSANLVNLTNDGVIDIQGGGLRLNVGTGGVSSIGGGTVTSTSGSQFKIASGANAEVGGSFVLGGSMEVASGASFTRLGGFTINTGGLLSGAGTVNVGTGALLNNGTLAPGSIAQTIGTLRLTGNYTQGAGGTLAIELEGSAAGQFDVLAVSGTATLAGTLTAGLINDFLPGAGNQFAVLTASARVGDFGVKTLPSNFTATPGLPYLIGIGGTACNGTICFDNTGGDFLWSNPLNWNTDALPTLSDSVFIDLLGNNTIVLNTGIHSIGSLSLSPNNTLDLVAGSLTLFDDSLLTGTLKISGGSLVINASNVTANAIVQNAGTLTVNAGNTLRVDGQYDWTGGSTIAGPGTLALLNETTWNINDTVAAGFHLLSGVTVNNAGVVNYSVLGGNSRELLLNGSVFNNQAGSLFDFKSDALVSENGGGGGSFNNNSVVKKSSGTGNSGFSGQVSFNNTNGTVDSGTGAILLQTNGTHSGTFTVLRNKVFFNAATHNFADGSVLNGTINFNGATVNLGTATVNDTLNLTSGTVNLGSKTTTLDGVFNWTSGATIAGGTLALTAANVANVNDTVAAGFHLLSGVTVNNAGVLNYNVLGGNSRELLLNGSVFNNQAGSVFDFNSDALVSENGGGGGSFNNSGLVKKSGGTGNSGFNGLVSFNNTNGTVDSGTGTMLLQTNGTHSGTFTALGTKVFFKAATQNFADGSVLNGVINFNGATVNLGTATFNDTLNLTSGTVNLGSKTTTLDGVLNWTGGATIAGGTLALTAANLANVNDTAAAGFHVLSGVTVNNAGVLNYNVSGGNNRELLINDGSVFNNLAGGIFDFQGDIAVLENSGCDPCRFNNSGVVVKSTGTGVGGVLGNVLTVSNDAGGVFRANSGTLQMRNFNVNDGTIDTATGAHFALVAGTLINNGTLSGRGSIDASDVVNNGTIAPSLGAPLRINGNLSLSPTSVVAIDINGTVAGTSHDAIDVSGNLILGGTLQATRGNGFVPPQNSLYDVLQANAISGSFANRNLPANFSAQVTATDVTLHFFGCAGSICFDNDAGDFLWNNPLNWTGNVLPVAGDDVSIDLGAALTVRLDQGLFSAGSLLTASDVLLSLTGGSLMLNNASTLNGGLNVNGGRLDSLGALTVGGDVALSAGTLNFEAATVLRGNLTLSGGVLGGAGNVSVARTLAWSDGTLGGAGTTTVGSAGRLLIGGSATKFLDGSRTLINNSTTGSSWSGSGEIAASGNGAGSASFINNGSLVIQTAAAWSDGDIVNNGTMIKSAIGGMQIFNGHSGRFDNAGVFQLNAGDLQLAGGGTHSGEFDLGVGRHLVLAAGDDLAHSQRFLTGANFNTHASNGGGVIDMVSGTVELAGTGNGLHIGSGVTLNLSGATLTGSGNLTVDAGSTVTLSAGNLGGTGTRTMNDQFEWTGGAVTGGSLITNSVSVLRTDAEKVLSGTTWINLGRAVHTGGALNLSGSNARVSNRAGGTFALAADVIGEGRFDNDAGATLSKSSPGVNHIGVAFNNAGSIVISAGALQFDQNFTNLGSIDLGRDGESGIQAGAIDVLSNGTRGRIFGSGFINVASAGIAFTNAGVMAPGHSPGTITVRGDFVQTASGTLAVEIGGTRPGADFDLLNVSGRATLAGAIALDLLNNFLPSPGGSFDIVNSTSLIGDFQSVILPSGQVLRGAALSSVYQISAAALLAGSVLPQRVIDDVLVMPNLDIAHATGTIVVNEGVGEPLIEFVPRRRASCN